MITQKWERWALGIVLAAAAILAALVSVGHVVAWTLVHSPPGTSLLAGLTNATISELLPFAGIVAYRACRRSGRSVFFPVVVIPSRCRAVVQRTTCNGLARNQRRRRVSRADGCGHADHKDGGRAPRSARARSHPAGRSLRL